MITLPSQRHLFDIPDHVAYFNCAYYSPQLNASKLRLIEGVESKSHPWNRVPYHFFADAEKIRQLASELFGGDADGYAIVPAASYGLSTAARAIEPQLKKNDQILVIAEEFPSNVLPWQRVATETGASILTVPTPADSDWTKAILNHLNKNVKVVAIPNCHWTNGAIIDLVAIAKACRTLGTILVVDATQSLGAMPISIDEVKPDFLVAAGYKWLLGPYGSGVFYVSPTWRNSRPLEESWLVRENAEDFAGLVNYSPRYMSGARKFDVGEKGMSTILPGLVASLEQIKAWGIPQIAETLNKINQEIKTYLEQSGFQTIPREMGSPQILGALLPKGYNGNLVNDLRNNNIYISQRGNSLRFAPHLHVNDNDIDRLVSTLTKLVLRG